VLPALSEALLQAARKDARHTPQRDARGSPSIALFHRASRVLRSQVRHSASWPRATRTSTRRSLARWAARRRPGADAAPATALTAEEPSCAKARRCRDCPTAAARPPDGSPVAALAALTWLARNGNNPAPFVSPLRFFAVVAVSTDDASVCLGRGLCPSLRASGRSSREAGRRRRFVSPTTMPGQDRLR